MAVVEVVFLHASSVKQGRPPRERLPRARVSFGIPAHLRTLLALTLGRSTSRESRWNGSVGGQTTVKKRFVESRNQLSVAEMCRTVSGGTYEQTTSLTSLTTSESTEPRELHAPPPDRTKKPGRAHQSGLSWGMSRSAGTEFTSNCSPLVSGVCGPGRRIVRQP